MSLRVKDMGPPVVILTVAELRAAREGGEEIYNRSVRDGRRVEKHVSLRPASENMAYDILGQIGEAGLCKALGIPYQLKIDVFHTVPDVGRFEVRSVDQPNHRMKIRDNDVLDRPFVLMLVEGNRVTARGWQIGHDVKKTGDWFEGHGERKGWWAAKTRLLIPMRRLKEFGGTE